MVEHSLELAVGEVLHVGDVRLTVLEIVDDEVTFQVESPHGPAGMPQIARARIPR